MTFTFHLIKTTVLPLMFFSHDDWWKTTVLPLIFYLTRTIIYLFSNMFFFMTTNKLRQCYPLYFIWQRQQCYPLCFFSWRPIKNNSVTPYVFFPDDQRKMTVSPLMFHLIKTTVLPPVLFYTFRQCYPLWVFHDDQRKTTVSPLMFHLIKTTVLPPMF